MGADHATMDAIYDETLKNFNEGSIVAGTILSVIDGDSDFIASTLLVTHLAAVVTIPLLLAWAL